MSSLRCIFGDKLGVELGSLSWVNSADSAVRSVEVEVQTWCATTIAVYASWLPHGDRSLNAWTNDFRALSLCAATYCTHGKRPSSTTGSRVGLSLMPLRASLARLCNDRGGPRAASAC